jgi:hypothetical protein
MSENQWQFWWQFGGNSPKSVLESGNLVAKICGDSGKKWQDFQ